jgi:diphthamide synthase (EF-2-diphthine--ammonia ligase)
VTTCVDSQALDRAFVGRIYDESFLAQLPAGVDPCGENGEFHTFVFDGPIFRKPVAYHTAEVVLRDSRYYFCDLVASDQAPKASTSDME